MKSKYQSNQLDGLEIAICKKLKEMCSDLDNFIELNIEDCREKSIAIVKLEECAMWATKGLAFNGPMSGGEL